jgi:hypothetical protein
VLRGFLRFACGALGVVDRQLRLVGSLLDAADSLPVPSQCSTPSMLPIVSAPFLCVPFSNPG